MKAVHLREVLRHLDYIPGARALRRTIDFVISGVSGEARIVGDGVPDGVAGFVEARRDSPVYLSWRMLFRPRREIAHVLEHEADHKRSGIFDIPVTQWLDTAQQRVLQTALDGATLGSRFLVEGLNELSTILRGYPNDSGYRNHEVPAAKKLEDLAQKHCRESVMAVYRAGNVSRLQRILVQIATRLQLNETVEA